METNECGIMLKRCFTCVASSYMYTGYFVARARRNNIISSFYYHFYWFAVDFLRRSFSLPAMKAYLLLSIVFEHPISVARRRRRGNRTVDGLDDITMLHSAIASTQRTRTLNAPCVWCNSTTKVELKIKWNGSILPSFYSIFDRSTTTTTTTKRESSMAIGLVTMPTFIIWWAHTLDGMYSIPFLEREPFTPPPLSVSLCVSLCFSCCSL